MADNGGNLMCLNLNTLQLVWVQDVLDDSNSTPVLEIENGHLYLYVSTSFRLGWRSNDSATIPIWKIDAETGEIIWHTDYECYTDDGVSGGVQSTIACGKNSFSDYIYVTVSKTSDNDQVFLPASKNQTDLKHGKIPPHMLGHRRSAFITKMEVEKYFIVTVQGMYGCLMVKQENWKIRCPSVTVSSKHHRLCTIIMQLLVPETAKYGELK